MQERILPFRLVPCDSGNGFPLADRTRGPKCEWRHGEESEGREIRSVEGGEDTEGVAEERHKMEKEDDGTEGRNRKDVKGKDGTDLCVCEPQQLRAAISAAESYMQARQAPIESAYTEEDEG